MDPARSDRAERHVFAALPELDAVPRRGLALTLAGVPRAGVALSDVLARARKSLRRTRAELPSAGRCERAERALSDRLDGATTPMDERFLEAHLGRCARCRTHATALDAATAKPVAARLRIVPPPPQLPPATPGTVPTVARIDVPPPFAPAHPAPASPTVVREPVVAASAAPTPAPPPPPHP